MCFSCKKLLKTFWTHRQGPNIVHRQVQGVSKTVFICKVATKFVLVFLKKKYKEKFICQSLVIDGRKTFLNLNRHQMVYVQVLCYTGCIRLSIIQILVTPHSHQPTHHEFLAYKKYRTKSTHEHLNDCNAIIIFFGNCQDKPFR